MMLLSTELDPGILLPEPTAAIKNRFVDEKWRECISQQGQEQEEDYGVLRIQYHDSVEAAIAFM